MQSQAKFTGSILKNENMGQVDSVEPVELVETVERLPPIPPVPPIPRNRLDASDTIFLTDYDMNFANMLFYE